MLATKQMPIVGQNFRWFEVYKVLQCYTHNRICQLWTHFPPLWINFCIAGISLAHHNAMHGTKNDELLYTTPPTVNVGCPTFVDEKHLGKLAYSIKSIKSTPKHPAGILCIFCPSQHGLFYICGAIIADRCDCIR